MRDTQDQQNNLNGSCDLPDVGLVETAGDATELWPASAVVMARIDGGTSVVAVADGTAGGGAVAAVLGAEDARASKRIGGVDAMRFLAVLGVIWVHAMSSASAMRSTSTFGKFGMTFFAFAAVWLVFESLRRNPARSMTQFMWARFRRLYVPFLAWSVIYLIIRDYKHEVVIKSSWVSLSPADFLIGTSYHLWFLPVVFLSVIACFALAKLVLARPDLRAPLIVACLVGSSVVFAMHPDPSPTAAVGGAFLMDRMVVFGPAVLLAIAFSLIYPLLPRDLWSEPIFAVGALLLVPVMLGLLYISRATPQATVEAGFICLLLALVRTPLPLVPVLAKPGSIAYGVYLVHVAVISTIEMGIVRMHLHTGVVTDLGTFVLGAAGSVAIAMLLARYRATAWLISG